MAAVHVPSVQTCPDFSFDEESVFRQVLRTVNILPCVPRGPRPRGTRWQAGVLKILALLRVGSALAREDFIC